MLVFLVPCPPVHGLRVDERGDVIGADPGRATWTSLLHFGDLLDGFRDGAQLAWAAHLHRRGQALQGHADWPRALSASLGAQLDLGSSAAKHFLPIPSTGGLHPVQLVTIRGLRPVCSRLDLVQVV